MINCSAISINHLTPICLLLLHLAGDVYIINIIILQIIGSVLRNNIGCAIKPT